MEEKVSFENSRGDKLWGILSNPSGDKRVPIIIQAHGFTAHKNSPTHVELDKLLNEKGLSTFRFDFFGHGESEGKFEDITISEAVDDVLKAIGFVKSLGYEKVGLVGTSFGGMASLIAASKTKELFVLALKSPVSDYLGKLIAKARKTRIDGWKENGFIEFTSGAGAKLRLNYTFFEDSKMNSGYDAARKIKIPTLIVHGGADETVPVEQSKKTAKIIEGCRLEIVEGADHIYSNPEHFQKMMDLIFGFVVEKAKG